MPDLIRENLNIGIDPVTTLGGIFNADIPVAQTFP
jgi:hypothetical protein